MMTEPRGVLFEIEGDVGRITLDRPDEANAFDLPAAHALGEAVAAAESSGVSMVQVIGSGRRFCAGGDVASFADASDSSAYLLELATVLEANARRLGDLDVPVLAAVHGAVAGAGLALVLNADVVVAARGTKFVMAYGSIGLTPDCGVSWMLPRAVGQQRAMSLALGGRILGAEEALQWGLVAEVVDDGQLVERVAELSGQLAAGPTDAFARTKRLLRDSWVATREVSARDEAETIARMVETPTSTDLVRRFLRR